MPLELTWRNAGRWRPLAVLMSIGLSLALLSPPDPAQAAPPSAPAPEDLCAGPIAAAQSIQAAIAAHNAKPHRFQLPRQAAQLAAYDAEAQKLNAQRAKAAADLRACVEAMRALADVGVTSLDLRLPSAGVRTALEQAQKRLPTTWKPAPAPPDGSRWEVPKTDPVRPIYDLIRKNNPGSVGNVSFKGVPRPTRAGATDPAYASTTGATFGRNAAGGAMVSPDHIIPLAELIYMPGFVKLRPEYMYVLSRAPLNYQWLSRSANVAKSSRSVVGMSGVDPQWRDEQVHLANEIRAKLQDIINKLLATQR